MMSHLLIIFVGLSAAVMSVSGNSAVKEIQESYSCCDRTIKFDQNCENTWKIKDKNFAYSKGETKQFIPPCVKLEGELMTLDQCSAVNVTVVCTDVSGLTKESHIHFNGLPCSGSASNKPGYQGLVGVMLLAVVVVAGSIVT